MAISSATGLGSGIDINNLVSQLVTAEGQPAFDALKRQESSVQARLSALGTLKGALSDFQTAVSKFKSGDIFNTLTATSANESLATVTTSAGAVSGSYSLEVMQLASAQKLISGGAGFSGLNAVVGSGTLNISSGSNSFSLTIDATNNTLSGIRDAINGATGNTGVNASIINVDDGAGGTVSKLILSSRQPGSANEIAVTAVDSDGNNSDMSGLSQLVYDPNGSGTVNMVQQTAAQDAIIKVDGQTATRSSNSLTDVVPGLSIDLKAAQVGTVFNVNVALDEKAVTSSATEFVAAYNKLNSVMKNLGRFNADSKNVGALLGDSTLRRVQNQIRQATSGVVSSATSDINSLGMAGIEIDRYGVMSLDSSKFNDIIKGNLSALNEVFSSSDGVATRLDSSLTENLQSGGAFDTQTTSLNDRLRSISDKRAQVQLRLDNVQKVLKKQFLAMDLAVGQFQSTGAYLAQQLPLLAN